MKLALLTNMIPPYRVEFFRELSGLCELRVMCDALSAPNRSWKQDPSTFGFDFIEMGFGGKQFTHEREDVGYEETRVRYSGKGFREELNRFNPDAVVSGELGRRTLSAARWAGRRKAFGIWWEGTHATEKQVTGPKLWLRKWLVRRARGFWCNGAASRRYLEDHGGRGRPMAEGITGISTHAYFEASQEKRARREEIRAAHGMVGTTLLFVGALSGRKEVLQLIDALRELDSQGLPECSVVFVGDGPLMGELEALREKLATIRIVLAGFQDQDGVQELLAAADVFVMPTLDDNWPLVTLEALVSGIPQIGSVFNGASEDLHDKTGVGWFLDPTNPAEFRSRLESVLREKPARVPDETVAWAREYYGPQQQAARAHELVRNMSES